jgi:hypothetical protein
MGSTTQKTWFDLFQSIAERPGDEFEDLSSIFSTTKDVTTQLTNIIAGDDRRGGITIADAAPPPVPSITTRATGSDSSPSGGTSLSSVVSNVFESGFGLVPLIGGLLGLFGGNDSPESPALVRYGMPERLSFAGVEAGSTLGEAQYDQWGLPRTSSPVQSSERAAPDYPTPGAPQITVNVQAMDSRSFLDHSNEIAQAVRYAMLNLNSINDVVNDL